MSARDSSYLPFSAFLGHVAARRALLCTLVDPTLRGVIVSGPVGTGKSALMRSFGEFVHAYIDADAPFVEVPLGVSDDRLLGGVDLDASLEAGEVRRRGGLITAAHEGFLFVDDLPLLEPAAAAAVVRALESELLVTERDGASAREVARFAMLATTVPAERELSIGIADRVAFLVGAERISKDSAHLLVRRLDMLDLDPERLHTIYEPMDRRSAALVATASGRLAQVGMSDALLREIAETAEELGVIGNRAELFAAKAARAHAALRGAREVGAEDLAFARAVVLDARAQVVPGSDKPLDSDRRDVERNREPETGFERIGERGRRRSTRHISATDDAERDADEQRNAADGGAGEFDEEFVAPAEFRQPLPSLEGFFARRQGRTQGKQGILGNWQRGRHTKSLQADAAGRRVAIGATLRAAAPHQKKRGRERGGKIVVRGDDLRIKFFAQRAGTLYIFCVDASGSMARNRMREAKGAVTRLLQDAYVRRDSVALIAFRGAEAEVLLPPTSSVERARRALDVLPAGGGTPLASALLKAYTIAELARRRGVEQTIVVLLTDGRGNVPLSENAAGMIMEVRRRHVRGELAMLGAAYRRAGIRALVVDTRQTGGSQSEAARLADVLGARYYLLPQLGAEELMGVVRGGRDGRD